MIAGAWILLLVYVGVILGLPIALYLATKPAAKVKKQPVADDNMKMYRRQRR